MGWGEIDVKLICLECLELEVISNQPLILLCGFVARPLAFLQGYCFTIRHAFSVTVIRLA